MLTYETTHGGMFLTIYDEHGRDLAFVQGEEAMALSDSLDETETDQQVQDLLDPYCQGDIDDE